MRRLATNRGGNIPSSSRQPGRRIECYASTCDSDAYIGVGLLLTVDPITMGAGDFHGKQSRRGYIGLKRAREQEMSLEGVPGG